MNVEQLIASMTPEIYQRLNYAVETGKWPDGTPLAQEQRDSCMQAVMLYQSKHNNNPEHMSVAVGGEIEFKSKAELKRSFKQGEEEIARVKVEE